MIALRNVLAVMAISACGVVAAASKKCTSVTNEYPFFMYAYNDGADLFGYSIAFQETQPGGAIGLALNIADHTKLYPTTFNITKANLISQDNDEGSHAYISDSLASNSYLTFSPYNKTSPATYGLFNLQQYGSSACIITVNHAVVPFYLCEDSSASNGQLFVTYQAPADRYCINIDLIAISEG